MIQDELWLPKPLPLEKSPVASVYILPCYSRTLNKGVLLVVFVLQSVTSLDPTGILATQA